MLSEHERWQLTLIEHDLQDDPAWAPPLSAMERRQRRRAWIRGSLAVAVVLIATGILTGVGELSVQGLLVAAIVLCWWLRLRSASPGSGAAAGSRPDR